MWHNHSCRFHGLMDMLGCLPNKMKLLLENFGCLLTFGMSQNGFTWSADDMLGCWWLISNTWQDLKMCSLEATIHFICASCFCFALCTTHIPLCCCRLLPVCVTNAQWCYKLTDQQALHEMAEESGCTQQSYGAGFCCVLCCQWCHDGILFATWGCNHMRSSFFHDCQKAGWSNWICIHLFQTSAANIWMVLCKCEYKTHGAWSMTWNSNSGSCFWQVCSPAQ